MSSVCPSLLRGRRLRATRLDGCGRPIYGVCGQVVSKGFIKIDMAVETDEGEELSQKNAAGEICYSEAPCEQIKWRTVTIDFCQVDPDLVLILNPTWVAEKDDQGNTVGWRGTNKLSCDTGYALEIWSDVANASSACSGGGGQGLWGYFLLPIVTGGVPGDLTIENGGVTFTFTGKTKVGSGWGVGPYPVILDKGVPSPLLTPIGPDEDHLFRLTTVAPPEAMCGCQPVARPIPPNPTIYISGTPGEDPRRTVMIRVDNHGFGPVMVDFGDSTGTVELADGVWSSHAYAADGNYTISAADKQTPIAMSTRDVTIPLPPDAPELSAAVAASDTTGQSITATWDNHGNGPVKVDFGDGSQPQDGADVGNLTYRYAVPGVFTIRVTDADEPSKTATASVIVPVPKPPVFTAAVGSSATIAAVTGDAANGETIMYIDWGDSTAMTTAKLNDGDTTSHDYGAKTGDMTITVTRSDNPLSKATQVVTIPFS